MTMKQVQAYFHKKGSTESEFHSEYDFEADTIKFFEVKNATVFFNRQLRVINEGRPIFMVATFSSPENKDAIWELSYHMRADSQSKKLYHRGMVSSDIGAIIAPVYQNDGKDLLYIAIRRNDETYFAMNTKSFVLSDGFFAKRFMSLNSHLISFQDLLEFISGDINWENLKNRGYILKEYADAAEGSTHFELEAASP